jgi:cytochrome c biogenesis protein CcmG/thiol:disulfide interchange protein DsbE
MSDETLPDNIDAPAQRTSWRGIAIMLPLSAFVGIAILLAIGLTMDPREVPSPLIDKPVPEFKLPPVQGRQLGLSSSDLKGQVSLVNIFASWCVACRQEHPLLLEIGKQNIVPIHGLNYKDEPNDAAGWLDALGDPYTRTGSDLDGRVGIDWGVYGVPETFVIDKNGNIAYKHIGPISQQDWETKIHPLVIELQSR